MRFRKRLVIRVNLLERHVNELWNLLRILGLYDDSDMGESLLQRLERSRRTLSDYYNERMRGLARDLKKKGLAVKDVESLINIRDYLKRG